MRLTSHYAASISYFFRRRHDNQEFLSLHKMIIILSFLFFYVIAKIIGQLIKKKKRCTINFKIFQIIFDKKEKKKNRESHVNAYYNDYLKKYKAVTKQQKNISPKDLIKKNNIV